MNTRAELRSGGFTLIELLVVLGLVGLGMFMLVPGVAHTQPSSRTAQCLSNKRQLAVACVMYTHDWNDYLVPNASGGASRGWCAGAEDWLTAGPNIYPFYYTNNCLARYIANQIRLYKCPGDIIPSANGDRVRSISMNGQMGALYGAGNYNLGWRTYVKNSDLTAPAPGMAWIFADESMYSLNDGYLQANLNAPDYPDVPAAYHGGINCLSFADGHAEAHRWQWLGNAGAGLLNCPYRYGVLGTHWGSSGQDVDWLWLRDHSAARQ